MSRADLLEQPSARKRMRRGFKNELTPEQIVEFEKRAEQLRRHPEKGMTWERVRAELKTRGNKRRATAGR
jgi:hypothetical protein